MFGLSPKEGVGKFFSELFTANAELSSEASQDIGIVPPKKIELTQVKVAACADPSRCVDIVKGLDETLTDFNDDFLTRPLRSAIDAILCDSECRERVLDIFYRTDFSLVNAYEMSRVYCYPAQKKLILQKDIYKYLKDINSKIEDLESKSRTLHAFVLEDGSYFRAISRIEAIVSILKRPIPMMKQLLIEVSK